MASPSYQEIFKNLAEDKVRYLVVGGTAVVFSGYARMTMDLDLLPDLESENLEKMISILDRLGYKPNITVPITAILDKEKREIWQREKGMKVFMLYHPEDLLNKVDILVFHPIDFEEAYNRRQRVITDENYEIPVVSIEDLINLKRIAGRSQDLHDIRVLQKIREQQNDR